MTRLVSGTMKCIECTEISGAEDQHLHYVHFVLSIYISTIYPFINHLFVCVFILHFLEDPLWSCELEAHFCLNSTKSALRL